MSKSNTLNKEFSPRLKIIFKLLTVVIPVLILLGFEGVLRLSGYGDNLNLFIQNPKTGYEDYLIVNPKVGKKYFQKFEYTSPANDIFLKDKPKNSFRIFVMGSSTVFGFPFDRNIMFSRILNKRLEGAYPNQNIEVVNTAITAINSFTLRDYIDEILDYKPDAILIYAGHNEFYGALGVGSNEAMSKYRWLTQLHLALMDYRVYQLLRNTISGVAEKIASNSENQVHGTLMKRIVADKDILLNSENYNLAMTRYEQNMDDILEKVNKKNIPVFFSELISNVKDLKPFNSLASDNLEAAIDVYNEAKKAESEGNFELALNLYYKAKDLDCIRFRASEDVNRIVHELAVKYGAHLVPMLKYYQENSPNKLIGDNLMTEHVHPNIEGNFLMSEAFFNEINQSKIMGVADTNAMPSFNYFKRNWGYTSLDVMSGYHNTMLLKSYWPFVLDPKHEKDYRLTYKPKSYTDSIVFSTILNKELMLADVRLELAKKYEASGQIANAYKEYEALLCTNPYLAVNYRDAANCLIQLGDLPRALKYFEKSLEYEESFFADFKIAEIYLIMADYDQAINYFEKAYSLAPNDKKVNILAKSFITLVYANKLDKANVIATELKRMNAGQYLNIPAKAYTYTNYTPYQTRTQVEQAALLISDGKNDEALELLTNSLEIYDSHIANRYIGEIYLQKEDYEKAIYYLQKVYKEFRTDPAYLNSLILIYVAKKDFISAKKYFQEIKSIDPEYKQLNQLSLLLS